MLTLEEILSELEKNTKFSRKQLYERVKKKHEELSGLISLEGAAHLVARDLGVNLLMKKERSLKIENIVSGMKNVNLKARITQVSEIREFKRKNKKTGRVCSLFLTDGSGDIRLPLWDKQVRMIEDGELKEGDIIEIKNAFAKENVFGVVELGLSRRSRIQKIKNDGSIPEKAVGFKLKRIPIKDVKKGSYEIRGSLVQVFNVNPIFKTCPECRTKVEESKKGYKCSEHGKIKPENNMIISGIADDGTATIRSVFFRDQAQALSGLDTSVLLNLSQDEAMDLIKENVLGKDVVVRGRIRKNEMFDRLEMIVNEVEDLNIEEESKKLINEIKSIERVK